MKFKVSNERMITNKDDLKEGPCVCVIRNRYTKTDRIAEGEVAPVPYKKNASKEARDKFGRNLVYVIFTQAEYIVGYYQ